MRVSQGIEVVSPTVYRVGGEVASYCGACQQMTEHLIVAMSPRIITKGVETQSPSPAKVECYECKGQHRFRTARFVEHPPKLKKEIRKPVPVTVLKKISFLKKSTSIPTVSTIETRKQVTEMKEKRVSSKKVDVRTLGRVPTFYEPQTKFAIGDVILHPKFGYGYVESTDETKMSVAFSDEVRILVQDRKMNDGKRTRKMT